MLMLMLMLVLMLVLMLMLMLMLVLVLRFGNSGIIILVPPGESQPARKQHLLRPDERKLQGEGFDGGPGARRLAKTQHERKLFRFIFRCAPGRPASFGRVPSPSTATGC
ncbi:hypothetical protein K490DRAFT_58203 [Saccharata proteae CBS 121410]|uniref:Uncharacterized protein n=1 Tax=Saccharata proteae CBS 121410 TaxID=1314787 RepID=A0A9P4LTU3_9PEZI|nr:hypothetical protein K490DRAFT_58203 [Saccharata proteae CBS 121410]